ncbi:MAG: hypothetical protein ACYDG5_06645 [Dehalococcoidales bacterium]
MTQKRNDQSMDTNTLSQDIQAYVKNRADKQDVKTVEARKHVEVQLILSELENLLLMMEQSDSKVLAARQKLFELKIAFYKTLDIK